MELPRRAAGRAPGQERVVTREGLERLERELERLRTVRRAEVAQLIGQALEMGTELTENAEYLAAVAEQTLLERRIAELEERLADARIADPSEAPRGTVSIGSRVRLLDLETRAREEYRVVGADEGDPREGKISSSSPVGSALIGRRKGDVVEVAVPSGLRRLRILHVEGA